MKQNFAKKTILRKILVPMMIIMVIQSGLFAVSLILGGAFSQMRTNALDILNERVTNRKNYIENEMIMRWSNIDDSVYEIEQIINDIILEKQLTPSNLVVGDDYTNEILTRASSSLLYMLRKNMVSGAYLVLNGDGGEAKPVVYFRDSDPNTNPYDNSDLTIIRGPTDIVVSMGIPTDVSWKPAFYLGSSQTINSDFFYKPFNAAIEHPHLSATDLGYWTSSFKLTETSKNIITYSMPIYDYDGGPMGVVGIEITTDYLRTLMPNSELSLEGTAAYVLSVEGDSERTFSSVATNGSLFRQVFGTSETLAFINVDRYNSNYIVSNSERVDDDVYGSVQYFEIYNTNTPFEQERWALIGIMRSSDLFVSSQNMLSTILVGTVLSLILGLVALVIVGRVITDPIRKLRDELANSDPNRPLKLSKLDVYEVDEISSVVESLSTRVAESAARMETIFEMSGLAIAAYEYDMTAMQMHCSGDVFGYLGVEDDRRPHSYKELLLIIDNLNNGIIEEEAEGLTVRLYSIDYGDGMLHWMRLRHLVRNKKALGVITDVTSEILEKRKIEYERDYDLMTNLINRRAFYTQMNQIFAHPENIGVAALVMLDLDNLKYINDTYGHDCGDDYIRCTASILRDYSPNRNVVISRMSGDEFYVFLYGYSSKDEVRNQINRIREGIHKTLFKLPDMEDFKVRASAGVAWYPSDSDTFEQLLKYADFAMYKVKNTVKGEFNEFDMLSYNKDSYLLNSKEDLNKLIDEELVDYYFQPIVNARTGEVFAYEALMRSRLGTLTSPLEILTLARSQSKLGQIERLTWFRSLNAFTATIKDDNTSKLFINSISNQMLSAQEFIELEHMYGRYFDRIVVEITEEEKPDEATTSKKLQLFNEMNFKIAIDDFGTGYNGESTLLTLTPDYLKVDMSIVRNVDTDTSRQLILQNIIFYAVQKNIKIIAEGVETKSEMEYLISAGVDYLQGYYIAMPQYIPKPPRAEIRDEIRSQSYDAKFRPAAHTDID